MSDAQKNQIALVVNNAKNMSSRQIADVVDKRHDNVKRTIETLASQCVISHPQIEDGEKGLAFIQKRFMQEAA